MISSLVRTIFFAGVVGALVTNSSSTSSSILSSSSVTITSFTSSKPLTATPIPSSGSCLYPINPYLGNVGDQVDTDCNRPGNPEVLIGYYNIYANEASWNATMSSSCSLRFETAYSEWKDTAPITTFMQTYTREAETTAYTTETHVQYQSFFEYTPVKGEGCCLNCSIFGGNVQVYYWPTPAPTPAVPTLVDAAGFTFISPSVYVAFESLYATDKCGQVGATYKSTTIGFEPGELKTAMAWTWNGSSPAPPNVPNVFSVADWSYEKNCTNTTSTFLQNQLNGETYANYAAAPASCKTGGGCFLDGFTITWNPCSPTLSVPTQLFTIQSEWRGCMQGIDAFYDPPYTLTEGGGVHAPIITVPAGPTALPVTTSAAEPAGTPTSPIASVTNPPVTLPTTTSSTSSVVVVDPTTSVVISTDPAKDTTSVSSLISITTTIIPIIVNPTSTTISVNSDTTTIISISINPISTTDVTSSSSKNIPTTTSTVVDPAAPIQSTTAQPVDPTTQAPIPITTPISLSPSITLTPGGPAITISGTTFSLPPSATAIIINGQTTSLPSLSPTTTTPPTISNFIIGSQTLLPGSALTISSTTYSLPSIQTSTAAPVIIINGSPSPIPLPTITQPPSSPPTISEYIIGSQTLVPGSALVISSTTYSLPSVRNPETPIIIINGQTSTFILPGLSTYIIGSASQTLIAGASGITVGGTVVSLMAGGTSVVVGGTRTVNIGGFVEATSSSGGIAGAIVSLGGFIQPTVVGGSTTSSSSGGLKTATSTMTGGSGGGNGTGVPAAYTGSGVRVEGWGGWRCYMSLLLFGVLGVMGVL